MAVENVEGAAVARVGEAFVFLFAERAHGRRTTDLVWAPFRPDSLSFGRFERVPFASPDPTGPGARPVAAIEVDSRGRIYVASTFDPENDAGPFRSVVWEAGTVGTDAHGQPAVVLYRRPKRRATLDGLKVESMAVRERRPGAVELFVGTDDENYGAVVRPLPAYP